MANAAIASPTATTISGRKYGSMSRDRRWALRWSYFFLVLFAIFFLMPPIYMFITSLKIQRGDLGGDQSMVGLLADPCRTTSSF